MLLEKLKQDLLLAQKSQDAIRLRALRVLLADIKNKEIELRPSATTLKDSDIVSLLQKGVRSRFEAVELYKKGNREDLVKKEEEEIAVLRTYLPEMLNEEELKIIAQETIAKLSATAVSDMGKVMAEVKKQTGGKADMAVVGRIVKEFLGQ
jgi:uncharacterized protein YqeY